MDIKPYLKRTINSAIPGLESLVVNQHLEGFLIVATRHGERAYGCLVYENNQLDIMDLIDDMRAQYGLEPIRNSDNSYSIFRPVKCQSRKNLVGVIADSNSMLAARFSVEHIINRLTATEV